jgi:hypothetical protein
MNLAHLAMVTSGRPLPRATQPLVRDKAPRNNVLHLAESRSIRPASSMAVKGLPSVSPHGDRLRIILGDADWASVGSRHNGTSPAQALCRTLC